jgi:hypothetical protein
MTKTFGRKIVLLPQAFKGGVYDERICEKNGIFIGKVNFEHCVPQLLRH